MGLKLGIVGSRGFDDYDLMVDTVLKSSNIDHVECIVSGGAEGADQLADRFANDFKKIMKVFLANWKLYGRAAGFKRNIRIVEESDLVIAFWDGESPGTQHTIKLCKQKNVPVIVVLYKEANLF